MNFQYLEMKVMQFLYDILYEMKFLEICMTVRLNMYQRVPLQDTQKCVYCKLSSVSYNICLLLLSSKAKLYL